MRGATCCLNGGTRQSIIGIISAGRVGSVLGAAFVKAGRCVGGTCASSEASLSRARALLPDVPILRPEEVVRDSGVVVIAVPDDAIAPLVDDLATAGAFRKGQVILHTSGAHGVAVLQPVVAAGATPLALHPAMTFTGHAEDVERLATSSVAVTAVDGDDVAWAIGEALAYQLGAAPVRVPEPARPLYHAALAHGANHLCTLVNDCVQLLSNSGVQNAAGLLKPLLSAALSNTLARGDAALTGPVSRGDIGTVEAHLRVLAEFAPDIAPSYGVLAKRATARARGAGLLDTESAHRMARLFQGSANGNRVF